VNLVFRLKEEKVWLNVPDNRALRRITGKKGKEK
jgi:hypothetical protein